MAVSSHFADMLTEALAPLGRVAIRRMFGGGGVYCDGTIIGLVADDVLYLKADETTKGPFEAEGCGPFVYHGKGKPIAMSYWRVPERLLDEPDEMVAWARTALGVARRSAAVKGNARAGAAGAKGAKGGGKAGPARRPRSSR